MLVRVGVFVGARVAVALGGNFGVEVLTGSDPRTFNRTVILIHPMWCCR